MKKDYTIAVAGTGYVGLYSLIGHCFFAYYGL